MTSSSDIPCFKTLFAKSQKKNPYGTLKTFVSDFMDAGEKAFNGETNLTSKRKLSCIMMIWLSLGDFLREEGPYYVASDKASLYVRCGLVRQIRFLHMKRILLFLEKVDCLNQLNDPQFITISKGRYQHLMEVYNGEKGIHIFPQKEQERLQKYFGNE